MIKADLVKYFEFLADLRESGKTNMWGATPYLQRRFPELDRDGAGRVHGAWMKVFGHHLTADEQVDEAIEKGYV